MWGQCLRAETLNLKLRNPGSSGPCSETSDGAGRPGRLRGPAPGGEGLGLRV